MFPNGYCVGNVVILAIFVYTVDFFHIENKVFAGVEKYGKNMNVSWVVKSVNLVRTACFARPFLVTSKQSNFFRKPTSQYVFFSSNTSLVISALSNGCHTSWTYFNCYSCPLEFTTAYVFYQPIFLSWPIQNCS